MQLSIHLGTFVSPSRPYLTFTAPYAYTVFHYSTLGNPLDWLVDLGSSHYVTTDLAALALHESYTTSDSVIIGNGLGLPIAHTGSSSLTSLPTPFFNNVLHVLSMSKNLISVSALCVDNPINFFFFLLFLSGARSSHRGHSVFHFGFVLFVLVRDFYYLHVA